MPRLCFALPLLCLLLACARPSANESGAGPGQAESGPGALPSSMPAARPAAILRAGEYPLWFQLTETGPVLLDTIEDACFSAALVPWPLARHIRFILARGDELVMAVNREGFLRLAPWPEGGLGLYHVPGGEFWRPYTVASLILFDEKPAALLYRDDRFLDTADRPPRPRAWTCGADSAEPEAVDIPALSLFPPEEGWDADTLFTGADGFWYYRMIKKSGPVPEIRLLRNADLARPGEEVSVGVFQNAAQGEPLSAAPVPLRTLLEAAFAKTGGASALVVSPDFSQTRSFAGRNQTGPALLVYYRNRPGTGPQSRAFFLAILPDGKGLCRSWEPEAGPPEPQPFTLPALPEGFVYTGVGLAGNTLFAAWEEQEEFNTGAAGFMVIDSLFIF